MSALQSATVDFSKGTVIVQNGDRTNTTFYEGTDAQNQMVVRLYYLHKAGIPTQVLNPVENLIEKVQAVAEAIQAQQFANLPNSFKNLKF